MVSFEQESLTGRSGGAGHQPRRLEGRQDHRPVSAPVADGNVLIRTEGAAGLQRVSDAECRSHWETWCLVFVAYSLLHLTCLPAVPDRTKGLIHTIGDACRHRGAHCFRRLLLFVHDQLSQGARMTMSLPSYLPNSGASFSLILM